MADTKAEESPELEQLQAILDRLVRRLTRREWATPRMMQIDAGEALSLLRRLEYPKKDILRRTLSELLRELGGQRVEQFRYVKILEPLAYEMAEELENPTWSRDEA